MHFDLVDRVVEASPDRIVTLKLVSRAEEYLQDHFDGFPVLPGVFMLEAMVQAARALVERSDRSRRLVLGSVRALKYGTFVRPGDTLRVEVTLTSSPSGPGADDRYEFKGQGTLICAGDAGGGGGGGPSAGDSALVAVSGRFVLRPVRVGTPAR